MASIDFGNGPKTGDILPGALKKLQDRLDNISTTVSFNNLSDKPTTLAGYGITDALSATSQLDWSKVTNRPTTISGYGITDIKQTYTKNDVGLGNVDNTSDATKSVLSASKLANQKTINGVVFDGTQSIVVGSTPTRTSLKALTPIDGMSVYLTEAGRAGQFVARAGAVPATDALEGRYVVSNTAGFYWERITTNGIGQPEWFGAVPGSNDAIAAIEASVSLYPAGIRFRKGLPYYISRTWKLAASKFEIQAEAGAELMVLSSVATVLQVGADSKPSGDFGTWQPGVKIGPLRLRRNAAVGTNAAPNAVLQYCIGLQADGLTVDDNCLVGFQCHGLVQSDLNKCVAFQTDPSGGFIGFSLDGAINVGAAGGNASLRIAGCTARTGGVTAAVTCIGLQAGPGFTDTFITEFETVGVRVGIDINGNGGGTTGNVDMRITAPVLDGVRDYGIRVRNLDASGIVRINNHYIAMAPDANSPGDAAAFRHDASGGNLVIGIGEVLGFADPNGKTFGLYSTTSKGLVIAGATFDGCRKPVAIQSGTTFDIVASFNNQTQTATQAAVLVVSSTMGYIRANIQGGANYFPQGVYLNDTGCQRITVHREAIDPAAVSGGDDYRVAYNGAALSNAGAFGTKNTLIGG